MKRTVISVAALTMSMLFCIPSFGQVYANKDFPLKEPVLDKDALYPYILPIWGKKAVERGFQLPYSAGLGVNYLWQESDLVIENLMVGFNNGPMYNLDEVIRFDGAVAEASAFNVRPDIWLFPFLNVYGLFVKAKTSTSIDASLWIPNADNDWTQVTAFSSKANFDATSVGFGLTPALGISRYWLAQRCVPARGGRSGVDVPGVRNDEDLRRGSAARACFVEEVVHARPQRRGRGGVEHARDRGGSRHC